MDVCSIKPDQSIQSASTECIKKMARCSSVGPDPEAWTVVAKSWDSTGTWDLLESICVHRLWKVGRL